MNIIAKLKEEREKNISYRKDLKEIQKKHGKYKTPFRREVEALSILAYIIFFVVLVAPFFTTMIVIKENHYTSNLEEHRALINEGLIDLNHCRFESENKTACISYMLDDFEYNILGIAITRVATDHALKKNNVELGMKTLDALKKLEISRHFPDHNFDYSLSMSVDNLNNSFTGKLYKTLKGEPVFENNILKKKQSIINEATESLREGLNLQDYEAVIRK